MMNSSNSDHKVTFQPAKHLQQDLRKTDMHVYTANNQQLPG